MLKQPRAPHFAAANRCGSRARLPSKRITTVNIRVVHVRHSNVNSKLSEILRLFLLFFCKGSHFLSDFLHYFQAAPPGLLSEIIGRQNPGRQQWIQGNGLKPRFAFLRHPPKEFCRRRFIFRTSPRRPGQNFQISRIMVTNRIKIPGTCDNFLVRFACTSARLQQNERLGINYTASEYALLRLDRIRCDPDAILQITKVSAAKMTP
jgi:hypothetical protein